MGNLLYVKNKIEMCGFSNIWTDVNDVNVSCYTKWFNKLAIHRKLEDLVKQEWTSEIETNTLCINYRIFKTDCYYEKYRNILNHRERVGLCIFR